MEGVSFPFFLPFPSVSSSRHGPASCCISRRRIRKPRMQTQLFLSPESFSSGLALDFLSELTGNKAWLGVHVPLAVGQLCTAMTAAVI